MVLAAIVVAFLPEVEVGGEWGGCGGVWVVTIYTADVETDAVSIAVLGGGGGGDGGVGGGGVRVVFLADSVLVVVHPHL